MPQTVPSFTPPQPTMPSQREGEQFSAIQPKGKANPLPWIITAVAVLGATIIVIYNTTKSNSSTPATNYNSSASATNYDQGNLNTNNSTRNANTYRGSNTSSNTINRNVRPDTSNSNSSAPAQSRTLAYCNANTLNVRRSPVLDLSKSNSIGELTRGDQVWIIRESSNYDTYNGITSNWAEIEVVDRSLRGWVFRYYLEIVDGVD
jgi:hypothetical protein